MIFLTILLFSASCLILFWSGSKLVESLGSVASYLGWREFVVAFFIVAVAASLPNLFVGVNASLQGITALSFGQIMGGNVVDLTLAIALAVLIGGSIKIKSKLVQASAVFTAIIAIIPLLLILDGNLSRTDGLALILTFLFYTIWLFSKGERFKDLYSHPELKKRGRKKNSSPFAKFKNFFSHLAKVFFLLFLLLIASWGIVESSQLFAALIGVSVSIIGVLLVGLGNSFPEIYFAILSARKGKGWLILGDLMGAVIIAATFVLGIIAFCWPIYGIDFSPFMIARIFLIISALFFLIFAKTGKEITKSEAAILLAIYFIFVFTELAFQV